MGSAVCSTTTSMKRLAFVAWLLLLIPGQPLSAIEGKHSPKLLDKFQPDVYTSSSNVPLDNPAAAGSLQMLPGGCSPPPPTLVSPPNGATNASVTPILDWSDVTEAASYQLQVAADLAFTNVVRSAAHLTASTWTVSPPSPLA